MRAYPYEDKALIYRDRRIQRMETALRRWISGEISRQKLFGVLRVEQSFANDLFWEQADRSYFVRNQVHAAAAQIRRRYFLESAA